MAIDQKMSDAAKKRKEKPNAGRTDHFKKGVALELSKRMNGELSETRKKFCQFYASHPVYRGNGWYCYALAYWKLDEDGQYLDEREGQNCRQSAYALLRDERISTAINAILDQMDLNPQAVDSQLAHLIHQHEDKSAKLGAIKEFNRMTNRGQQQGENAQTIINNLYLAIVQGKQPQGLEPDEVA